MFPSISLVAPELKFAIFGTFPRKDLTARVRGYFRLPVGLVEWPGYIPAVTQLSMLLMEGTITSVTGRVGNSGYGYVFSTGIAARAISALRLSDPREAVRNDITSTSGNKQ